MYMRLLIADDDDYTREGLKESIDWEPYGIDEILLAGDGAEALRICSIHKPEIVLTDIRMPKLNGIEFAEKLSEKSPGSILIFMSGYMDVEYLRSAIKLSAVEYIEKPIKLTEVEQAILKSVRVLQEKQAQTDVFRQKNELVKQKLAGLLRGCAARQGFRKISGI
jgi:two-component system, response regulator YesN